MNVIEFNNVSKSYMLGASRTSMREALATLPRKILRTQKHPDEEKLFWALKDVSFQVEQGEVLGIIGHNGAGKSTSLKLLSKLTLPTNGSIHTRGRIAALIELGAGFHPDLTGRDNIFLNGAILGLKRQEIKDQFDSIVDFSGLERFIDTPVKRYSSGMYVRLAFAVAAHIRADLLLVDEVLSVGDMAFQKKSMDKMYELREKGTTIVFVSHNLWAVQSFCKRVLLFRHGHLDASGEPTEIVSLYRAQERQLALEQVDKISQSDNKETLDTENLAAYITKTELLNESGEPVTEFSSQDPMRIRCHFATTQQINVPMFIVRIRRASSGLVCCALSSPRDGIQPISGTGTFEVRIDAHHLVPGLYDVQVQFGDREYAMTYHITSGTNFGVTGVFMGEEDERGVFNPPTQWTIPVMD